MIDLQEPPPYVQFIAEGKRLIGAAVLTGFCPAYGYAVDETALNAEIDRFSRRALAARVTGPVMDGALEDAGAEASHTASTFYALRQDPETAAEGDAYFRQACQEASARYPGIMAPR